MPWYKTDGNIPYWIVGTLEFKSGMFPATSTPPENLEIRNYGNRDQYVGNYTLHYPSGLILTYESYYCPPGGTITKPVMTQKQWPTQPTFENLKKYIGSAPKSFVIEPNVSIHFRKDSEITLLMKGEMILQWTPPNFQTFYHYGNVAETIVLYEKYAGKDFSFNKDTYKIKTKETDWLILFNGMSFEGLSLSSVDLYRIKSQAYERNTKLIDSYVNWITPQTIRQLYGSLRRGDIVSSRCRQCQNRDVRHLPIHLHRRELPFFILTEVYRIYDGDKADLYQLIEGILRGNQTVVDQFKVRMRSFLMDCFLGMSGIMFSMKPTLGVSHWTSWNKKEKDLEISLSFAPSDQPVLTGGVPLGGVPVAPIGSGVHWVESPLHAAPTENGPTPPSHSGPYNSDAFAVHQYVSQQSPAHLTNEDYQFTLEPTAETLAIDNFEEVEF